MRVEEPEEKMRVIIGRKGSKASVIMLLALSGPSVVEKEQGKN